MRIEHVLLTIVVKNLLSNTENAALGNEYLGVNEYVGLEYINAHLMKNGVPSNICILPITQLSSITAHIPSEHTLVCFSMYVDIVEPVLEAARYVKEKYPKIPVALGGPQVTGFEAELLEQNSQIDYIVSGEGEQTILELIQNLNNTKNMANCAGLTYRDATGNITQNAPRPYMKSLDDLEFPTRTIYECSKQDYLSLAGSRGCMGSCSFCEETSAKKYFGKPFVRHRTAKNIADEITYLQNKYGVSNFRFTDPTFDDKDDNGKAKDIDVYNEIINRGLQVRMHIFSRSELIAAKKQEDLELARKAGVECIYIGIEGGNAYDLALYNKKASLAESEIALQNIRNAGIHASFGFININPYTNYERLLENNAFLYRSGLGHIFYLYQTKLEVLAQTPIRKRLKQDNLLIGIPNYRLPLYSYRYRYPYMEDLQTVIAQAYIKSPTYYMDTTMSMDRIYCNRMLHNTSVYSKIESIFSQLDQLKDEIRELNFYFINSLVEMSQNGASLSQMQQHAQAARLERYHDLQESLFMQLKVVITKQELLKK